MSSFQARYDGEVLLRAPVSSQPTTTLTLMSQCEVVNILLAEYNHIGAINAS